MSNQNKVVYHEGYWESWQSGDICVTLERIQSDSHFTGYSTAYLLSWRVCGEPTSGSRRYATSLEQGREFMEDLGYDDAKAIRRAIAKYDELAAKYPQEKSDGTDN